MGVGTGVTLGVGVGVGVGVEVGVGIIDGIGLKLVLTLVTFPAEMLVEIFVTLLVVRTARLPTKNINTKVAGTKYS